MRVSSKFSLAAAAPLIALTACISGCSVVGFGAGMAIDKSLSDKKIVDKWACGRIMTGTEVKVTLVNGSSVSGEFDSLGKMPDEEYVEDYAAFRDTNSGDIYLPAIGDTIRIKDWGGDKGPHRFIGFDCGLANSRTREFSLCLAAEPIGKSKEKSFPLKYFEEMEDTRGNMTAARELKKLNADRGIPLRTQAVLKIDSRLENIKIEDINSLEIPRKKRAKWVGLGLGLAVDAVVLAAAIAISSMDFGIGMDGAWF